MGDGPVYSLLLFTIVNWSAIPKVFLYIIVIGGSHFIMPITKNFHHDPRPYFVDDATFTYDCSHEFGNPSGHALIVTATFAFLFLDNYHNTK